MDSPEYGAYASIEKIKKHLNKTTIFYDSLINSVYYFEDLDDVWTLHLLIVRFALSSIIRRRIALRQRFRTTIKPIRLHSVILCIRRAYIPKFLR